jgi:hypothetical protein
MPKSSPPSTDRNPRNGSPNAAARPASQRYRWQHLMIPIGVLVLAASAVLAFALIRNPGQTTGTTAGPGNPAPAGSPAAGNGVCLSGQACAATPWFQQPDFAAVTFPQLLKPLHLTRAHAVALIESGKSLTQIAATGGLDATQWHQDEAIAVAAGLDALIAKNELAIPGGSSKPGVSTVQQYRGFIVQAAYQGRLDNVLSAGLGVPLQQIPGLGTEG